MSGEDFVTRPHPQPLPTWEWPADWSGAYRLTEPAAGPYPDPRWRREPSSGMVSESECVCGRVCVCGVPVGIIRSVASFVAEWHPSTVVDDDPIAGRAEDATVCRCGQAFCGYRIFARTMRRCGAYTRA